MRLLPFALILLAFAIDPDEDARSGLEPVLAPRAIDRVTLFGAP